MRISTINRLLLSDNGHFWQGKVGLWKKVIPFHIVEKIVSGQKKIFSAYGYESIQNIGLGSDGAEGYWRLLCR